MVFSSVYHCPSLNHLLTPSYATGFQAFLPYFLGKCLFKVGIDGTKDLLCIYATCQLGGIIQNVSSHIMPHFVSSHIIPFFRDARNRNATRWWFQRFSKFYLGEMIQMGGSLNHQEPIPRKNRPTGYIPFFKSYTFDLTFLDDSVAAVLTRSSWECPTPEMEG